MSDLPEDIWIDHILPYVGDFHFRFLAVVDKSMYRAYNATFPSKVTKFNDDTKELTDICIREFRSETVIKECVTHYPMKCYRSKEYAKKKGYKVTLLQLIPIILRHNDFMELASRAAGKSHCLSILKWLYWYCHSSYWKRPPVWEWNAVFEALTERNYVRFPPFLYHSRATVDYNFPALRWAKEKTNIDICGLAVTRRNNRVLEWYVNNGWHYMSEDVCANAALSRDFGSIEWAHMIGFPWDATTCSNAALQGELGIVQWAHAHGCPWDAKTCSNAALQGHLHIIKWARENHCPWDTMTCSNAALRGHFEIVKWAHENGCPWDATTCSNAKRSKNWNIYRWARSHGCPHDKIERRN